MSARRILVTGCSGGGKSTLVTGLGRLGWSTVAEPGRRIVRSASGPGDPRLPWNDPVAFARAALKLATHDYLAAKGTALFDRGIVDAVLALRRAGAEADETLLERYRYDDTVWLAPPWPELFAGDAERRHDLATAEAEYADLAQTIPNLGYRVVTLPKLPRDERTAWLAARLS